MQEDVEALQQAVAAKEAERYAMAEQFEKSRAAVEECVIAHQMKISLMQQERDIDQQTRVEAELQRQEAELRRADLAVQQKFAQARIRDLEGQILIKGQVVLRRVMRRVIVMHRLEEGAADSQRVEAESQLLSEEWMAMPLEMQKVACAKQLVRDALCLEGQDLEFPAMQCDEAALATRGGEPASQNQDEVETRTL